MPDDIETFRSSLRGVATLHETPAADAADTLAAVIEEPAVGTPLPFEGISLPDAVLTEFSPDDLEAAETGVTPARHAVASYGTVTVPTDAEGAELVSLYATRHVAVLAASAVLPDMKTAYERLEGDIADPVAGGTNDGHTPHTQILATGPSATADMGTLVQGVHGPDEVHLVLVDDR
jgi:L-lactate dehydrogenase complex protein LldG